MGLSFDEMYGAVERRDSAFDGLFFTAVKTTRIFCRPVCPARTPFARNVEFFGSAKECLYAGYRPCLRCRPLDMGTKPPEWVRDLFARVDRQPEARIKDQDLREMGIEPERARRWFKTNYGMTFQGYHRSRRMGIALREIRAGADAVEAAMKQGYDSDSGFRDAFEKILGAPPSRATGIRAMSCRWLETPLGPMLAIADDAGLCLLEFVDRRMLPAQIESVRRRFGAALVPGEHPILDQTAAELAAYFAGDLREFSVKLNQEGTPFQMRVWEALMAIPYGVTASYGEQARRVGDPKAVRAVAAANGANRIGIIIPCHRVIAANGALQGYGGGLWRKQKLLDLERGELSLF